jgi:D-serine deaminase-like pyridoxal phosphate-dependent protein
MDISALATPCALVDLDRLEANAATMCDRAAALGVSLRPHVKTHKVPAIARIQHQGAAGPITASTLAEARAFAAAGFDDILWALPLAPDRAVEAMELAASGLTLALLVDSDEAVDAASSAAAAAGLEAALHIKIDCGYGRAGLGAEDDALLALARRIHRRPATRLAGVLTHGGHAYACTGPAGVRRVAEQERMAVVRAAQRLLEAGLPCPAASVGSTPTVVHATGLGGVTEVRPGNYAFFDAFQSAIGSCTLREAAFTVLATVVGRYPGRDGLVIDAGSLALSADSGPRQVDPDCGFGAIFSPDQRVHHRQLRLVSLSQEHGKVIVEGGLRPGAFPVGSRLRIVPNHSCLAAACHPVYHAVRGREVRERWEPVRGW